AENVQAHNVQRGHGVSRLRPSHRIEGPGLIVARVAAGCSGRWYGPESRWRRGLPNQDVVQTPERRLTANFPTAATKKSVSRLLLDLAFTSKEHLVTIRECVQKY